MAAKNGAEVHYESSVTASHGTARRKDGVTVEVQSKGTSESWRARAIVERRHQFVVARTAGCCSTIHATLRFHSAPMSRLLRSLEKRLLLRQRILSGYGWMFPMSEHGKYRVGILKETCQREGIAVPELFRHSSRSSKLHPACRR